MLLRGVTAQTDSGSSALSSYVGHGKWEPHTEEARIGDISFRARQKHAPNAGHVLNEAKSLRQTLVFFPPFYLP